MPSARRVRWPAVPAGLRRRKPGQPASSCWSCGSGGSAVVPPARLIRRPWRRWQHSAGQRRLIAPHHTRPPQRSGRRRCACLAAGSRLRPGPRLPWGRCCRPARCCGPGRPKRISVTLHVLHHDHAISASGYRSASHDLNRLAGLDRPFSSLAGADQSNDLKRQVGSKVGGAAGESIAGGAGKRRLIPVGKNRSASTMPRVSSREADCGRRRSVPASRSACSRTIRLASA